MAATIYQLSDGGALPRVDWMELDSGTTGGTDGKVGVIRDSAGSTDANGNPTPNTTTYPPADYPPGSLFYATGYPAGVGNGSMIFQREGGAGSEAWVWRWGSFRASNANGSYQRDADGRQECRVKSFQCTYSTASLLTATWTFPAAFSVTTGLTVVASVGEGITGTAIPKTRFARSNAPTATSCAMDVNGDSYVSGEVAQLMIIATGQWK